MESISFLFFVAHLNVCDPQGGGVEAKIGVAFFPQIIHGLIGFFHDFHHPFWGFSPYFGNTQLVNVTFFWIFVCSIGFLNEVLMPPRSVFRKKPFFSGFVW